MEPAASAAAVFMTVCECVCVCCEGKEGGRCVVVVVVVVVGGGGCMSDPANLQQLVNYHSCIQTSNHPPHPTHLAASRGSGT